MSNAFDIVNKVRSYSKNNLIERDEAVDNILSCMISGQHCFFLGVPGVAKSLTITTVMSCISGVKYFDKLIMAGTTADELFGPVDLQALKTGTFKFKTEGFAADADFAFLDEFWKGNSQVLNSLLTLMNERKFTNGAVKEDAPLMSVFAASNELPADDSLNALYDRFMVRMDVRPIQSDRNFERLLGFEQEPAPEILTLDIIKQAAAEAKAIDLSDIFPDISELRARINHSGEFGGKLQVSDRRWKMILKFLKARLWLDGEAVTRASLRHITDCLWSDPTQRDTLADILSEYIPHEVGFYTSKIDQIVTYRDMMRRGEGDVRSLYSSVKQIGAEAKALYSSNPHLHNLMDDPAVVIDASIAMCKKLFMESRK